MGLGIAVYGGSGTGKSFARKPIVHGDKCFVIMPTPQPSFLTDEHGKAVLPFDAIFEQKGKQISLSEYARAKAVTPVRALQELMVPANSAVLKSVTGNYVTAMLNELSVMMMFINSSMPDIDTIFIADVSHFITSYVTNAAFRKRNEGGEAFARYDDLGSDIVQNMIFTVNKLKPTTLVITEYHEEYEEATKKFGFFMPRGNQVKRSFKIEGMYAYTFASVPDEDPETGEIIAYRFRTTPGGKYAARSQGNFDTFVPNDWEFILNKIREKENLTIKASK